MEGPFQRVPVVVPAHHLRAVRAFGWDTEGRITKKIELGVEPTTAASSLSFSSAALDQEVMFASSQSGKLCLIRLKFRVVQLTAR
jgi:hypothetical protein